MEVARGNRELVQSGVHSVKSPTSLGATGSFLHTSQTALPSCPNPPSRPQKLGNFELFKGQRSIGWAERRKSSTRWPPRTSRELHPMDRTKLSQASVSHAKGRADFKLNQAGHPEPVQACLPLAAQNL
ncbi:hypothetical protein PoB_003204400 [Plakobranchus ocellatus]|uniref:Uncharacterized protein n=1 Tax=Plakobranchus ocellatus TaxID=259542 RepID=A0AAV4AD15_9GAST|nr:hypothetical protein PoB_003204400 [Plakobranchus ocellatus]